MKNGRFRIIKVVAISTLAAFLLSGTVLMASPQTREVIFGVGVSLNGQRVDFDADSQPFLMDGRTFLPVRAIADMVGLDVDFDDATNTVLLTGGAVAVQPADAPATLDSNLIATSVATGVGAVAGAGSHLVESVNSLTIDGNALGAGMTYRQGLQNPTFPAYSVHNLGERYGRLVGTVGIVENQASISSWRFIGDGLTLANILPTGTNQVYDIDIDISGVSILRIEVQIDSASAAAGQRAVAGFAGEFRP